MWFWFAHEIISGTGLVPQSTYQKVWQNLALLGPFKMKMTILDTFGLFMTNKMIKITIVFRYIYFPFLKMRDMIWCPVEGCQGRAMIRTNIWIHLVHCHMWDTLVILEEGFSYALSISTSVIMTGLIILWVNIIVLCEVPKINPRYDGLSWVSRHIL